MHSIISNARNLFAENGFDRTTIDAIAELSGVSKMTIYSHFKSKEELFGAIVLSKVEDEFAIRGHKLEAHHPEVGLPKIAQQFLSLMRKDEVLGTYRTMFASTSTHPELCRVFYQNGPVNVHREVAEYLKKCADAGSLSITDCDAAATQFLSLFVGLDHMKCLLGLGKPTKKEDADLISSNVEFFIKAKSVSS